MKHECISGLGCGCGCGCGCKCRCGIRQLKNYLKYFYLYFLYIFTIKIFLKNTLLCLDSQNKERRRQETPLRSEFRLFRWVSRPISAISGLFRPYQPPTNMIRYGLILAELARFDANRNRFGVNRSRVSANPRKKNKSPDTAPTRRQLRRTRVWHPPAAYMLSRFFQVLLLVVFWKVFFFNLNFH